MLKATITKYFFGIFLFLGSGLFSSMAITKEFVFTAIPDQDESHLVERFSKVAAYLQEELGVAVRYVPVKSYAAAVSAFRRSDVQLAWFGGLSGVQARALVPGSQALAQGHEDQFFKTYFIAHTSTKLEYSKKFPQLMAGKSFTFGSKGSTSGRLMPEYYVRQNLGEPDKIFELVGFSGDHSRTIALVQAGSYQLGAVNYQVWQRKLQNKEIDESRIRVIWETPVYPDYQWTIRGDVDSSHGEGFTDRVRQALLSIDDPLLLAAFPRQSFVPATNDDYLPIYHTARQIGLMD